MASEKYFNCRVEIYLVTDGNEVKVYEGEHRSPYSTSKLSITTIFSNLVKQLVKVLIESKLLK